MACSTMSGRLPAAWPTPPSRGKASSSNARSGRHNAPGQVVRANASREVFRDLVSQRLANIEDAVQRAVNAGGAVVIWWPSDSLAPATRTRSKGRVRTPARRHELAFVAPAEGY